ncbi:MULTISPECIES: N-acetylmuramic acid 6-phosphate etherase [Caldilinea]|uniref:N-acetylmuramic acid 6-phosphate etherase n=1 Tax=Caldilinea aerophila (strain DSM 14535 / JCM 11387 / NBRC 104270 / STL-6-O1) TaxID=926550 RepID=I0I4R0_CALAS|nr:MULTISPECIES: N-acetylmuramic acid 6-phosphate etherase [Caldilinea]MBO9393384.1 N-acetylmuramic acid 6-phosphate etherase [Caldilinea sp.]BAM00248.1 N-acetylmuramic acid 6-phosphate etherase [Caldilinea aerophila DSM 14535 = NBRC 104270]GIV71605.1 MAG: N-acetylmuramic acid 6-phosphate etherase [Caldilinea sp.]
MDLRGLITEQRNPHTFDIDERSTLEIVTLINQEDARVAPAVEAALHAIAALVDAAVSAIANGGRLIYVGAGTSGRLGVLDASECPPTFGIDPRQIVGVIAGGDAALRYPIEGVEDDAQQGVADMKALNVCSDDVVVGIAASGRTPYTLAAMRYARSVGARVGCIVNNPHTEMERIADYPVVILCGPEVITGSTRMKAGTAQKMALNMISTATMIRLGKVYQNLMVDMATSNAKLRARAVGILCEITGVDEQRALSALEAYGSVKTAAFALLTGAREEEVKAALEASGGHLKQALQLYRQRQSQQ